MTPGRRRRQPTVSGLARLGGDVVGHVLAVAAALPSAPHRAACPPVGAAEQPHGGRDQQGADLGERAALVAYLEGLTHEGVNVIPPTLP